MIVIHGRLDFVAVSWDRGSRLDSFSVRHYLCTPRARPQLWSTLFGIQRVSRLILMNPAPASASDFVGKVYTKALGSDMDRQ